MSIFAKLALEGADGSIDDEVNGPSETDQSTSNAISETNAEYQEAAKEEDNAQDLDEAHANLENLTGTVKDSIETESVLDPTAARLMHLMYKSIVGEKHAKRTLPAVESWNSSRSEAREANRVALEGMKETLKAFWQAIKAQFRKVYSSIKSFFVKTFSAAKKLAARAKKLQEKANNTNGTIEEKSFSFSQTKTIAVNGKYSEANSLTKGLTDLAKIVESFFAETKKNKIEDTVETLTSGFEAGVGRKDSENGTIELKDTATVDAFIATFTTVCDSAGASHTVSNKDLYDLYAGDKFDSTAGATQNFVLKSTTLDTLPGGKAIYAVVSKETTKNGEDVSAVAKLIKSHKLLLGNDKKTPREVSEGDVKTLTSSQVDKMCDDVIEIGEAIYTFEKSWEARDKVIARVEKELDVVVKEVESADDVKNSNQQRHVREMSSALVGLLRRVTVSFPATLSNYALTTANAFLNYGERSLAQHKSK